MFFLTLLRRADENIHYFQKVGWWPVGFHTRTAAAVSLPCTEVCDGTGSAWPTWCQLGASTGLMWDTWAGRMSHVMEHQPGSTHCSLMRAERYLMVLTGGAARTALAKGTPLLSETGNWGRHQQSTSSCSQVSFKPFWKEFIGHKEDSFICPFSPYLLHSVC